MAIKQIPEKISHFLKKYKYAVLILMIGLGLMIVPNIPDGEVVEVKTYEPVEEQEFEEKLATVLSYIEGAGEVRVILSKLDGEETLYQTNDDQTTQADSVSKRTDTVTVTDSNRTETGLIKQIIPATYKGAIILCQGADNPSVRYDIVNSVSKLIGIGTNCISVLKMK